MCKVIQQKFEAAGMKHGGSCIDCAHEKFNYNATATPALVKATTCWYANDGASVDESKRVLSVGRSFDATAAIVYVQICAGCAGLESVGRLRLDNFKGKYAATSTATAAAYNERSTLCSASALVCCTNRRDIVFSMPRMASFNTSGDTYRMRQTANTTRRQRKLWGGAQFC
jgi:hypothetical protein